MKIYAPNYYTKFKCIADRCRHSCCIGWDVYIDEDTLDRYYSLEGTLGEQIRNTLCEKDGGVCFEMCRDGRCPFLNKEGLCRIIINKGEGYLSEICSEHPRFYNFFSHRTEVGLGLSCEEAARIILGNADIPSLIPISDDGSDEDSASPADEIEIYILQKRDEIANILWGSDTLSEKIKKILLAADTKFPEKTYAEWAEILSHLERLDKDWDACLGELSKLGMTTAEVYVPSELENAFVNLLFYFIYRHASASFDMEDFRARICFALLGFYTVLGLCLASISKNSICTFEKLLEFARMYSGEIEYSEENTEALISFFTE